MKEMVGQEEEEGPEVHLDSWMTQYMTSRFQHS